jgi:hypothetical protein
MHYKSPVVKKKEGLTKIVFLQVMIYALQYIFGSLALRDILERLKTIINHSFSYSWDKLIWSATFLMLMIEKKTSHNRNG